MHFFNRPESLILIYLCYTCIFVSYFRGRNFSLCSWFKWKCNFHMHDATEMCAIFILHDDEYVSVDTRMASAYRKKRRDFNAHRECSNVKRQNTGVEVSI